ncbi:hypothetical protein GCM10025791_07810 [Halioxenophilus aromaticivorans]|uniref:Peptidase M12A domain-containing protein n=2 Tax=Halioxenophilus aromaticivorans TaxID=1306992 RepID=A0AAV3TYV0_9ALTE
MTNEEKERIRAALNNIEANTVIDFREISGRDERAFRTPEHLLNFCFDELDSAAGVSPLGFTGVRDQDIRFQVLDRFGNLRNRSTIPRISSRAIYHEVFHALGAIHEHQRPDRDLNIRVNFDNMVSGPIARAAMEVIPGASTITPYDFGSIMHYSPTAFARDESTPTITRRDGSALSTATRPSAVDYDGINLLYRDIVDGEVPPITAVRQMTLTINEVESPDEDGGAKTAIDFYAKVEIGSNWNWRPGDGANDTQHKKSGTVEEDDNIIHPNWQFSTLLLAGQPLGKASVIIRDDDGLSSNERTDQTVDIAEYVNQGHVEILVDGNSNRIYLAMPNGEFDADEYLGDIGDPIQLTRGTEGEIRGSITFTVDIHEVE